MGEHHIGYEIKLPVWETAIFDLHTHTDLDFFGYLLIIPVVSFMFSAGTLIVNRLTDNKRWGCYVIVAMAIVIPLLAVLIVRVSHWLTMKIYQGEKENLVAGRGYITPTAKETSDTDSA